MSHRSHLFSLRFAHALRETLAEGYNLAALRKDLLAGLSVGIIAIPLSMALAIASGVAPQYGLYTAIVAGFLIALFGGSRFSISGPTAAFVVILYPIAQDHGLAGLLIASLLAGAILILMAVLRLGRLIEYISESVVLGFTAGIAVVIATFQIKDFLGLTITEMPEHYLQKLLVLLQALPSLHWPSLLVASLSLACMLLWPRLKTPVPPHLPTVILGSLVAILLNQQGLTVETIGSRFSYHIGELSGAGIPPLAPGFQWPWQQPGANGESLVWSWSLLRDLLPAAFAIAMLGAIESLLCAVVLDGMSGKRHSANSELLGQGIGNLVTPFFGGITATAALARSAANFRAGAVSPISAMVHALVVLLGVVLLARALAWLPMPAMAALLLMVAWNMSEAPKAMKLLRTAPRDDVLVFLSCFSLTVLVDMVVAITVGIILATVLFMRQIAAMTRVSDISDNTRWVTQPLPEGWVVFKINGPLFFAAADRVFGELTLLSKNKKGIVLYMDGVPILDAGGLAALQHLIEHCKENEVELHIADLQFQPLKTLARAGIKPISGVTTYFATLAAALDALKQKGL